MRLYNFDNICFALHSHGHDRIVIETIHAFDSHRPCLANAHSNNALSHSPRNIMLFLILRLFYQMDAKISQEPTLSEHIFLSFRWDPLSSPTTRDLLLGKRRDPRLLCAWRRLCDSWPINGLRMLWKQGDSVENICRVAYSVTSSFAINSLSSPPPIRPTTIRSRSMSEAIRELNYRAIVSANV